LTYKFSFEYWYSVHALFGPKLPFTCYPYGEKHVFNMQGEKFLITGCETALNSAVRSRPFFSNFIFVYLWTSFKISFSTLKKSVFQAIFKFKLVSQPFYSFYWPGNWDSNLKLNLLRSFHHLELPEIFLSHVVLIHRGLSIFHFLGPNLF